MMCLMNDGVVSKNRRKQYQYRLQADVFDFIEEVAQALLRNQSCSGGEH
jgi:hypothetical protein